MLPPEHRSFYSSVKSSSPMFPMYGRPEHDGTFIDVFDEQLAKVGNSDVTYEYRVSLAVEIPLIFLAVTAVSLRVFSRIGIKKKLATDDILIIIGTVRLVKCYVVEIKGQLIPVVLCVGENGHFMHKFRRRLWL